MPARKRVRQANYRLNDLAKDDIVTQSESAPGRSTLPRLETALLWSLRLCTIGPANQHQLDHVAMIRRAYAGWGAPGVPEYLFDFMSCLRLGARRNIEIVCVCPDADHAG